MMPMKIIKGRITLTREFEDMYHSYNENKEQLGYLKYERVGRHKHWCWYQHKDIRMSPGCLQDIRDLQKKLLSLIRNQVIDYGY